MALIDLIQKNEDSVLFLTLLRKGVIPISLMDRKVYYLFYISQCEILKKKTDKYKMEAIQNTMEEFNIKSEKTIYNAISLMES